MTLKLATAVAGDAARIAEVRNRAASHLTAEFGGGHWSSVCTALAVRNSMRHSQVLVARDGEEIVATLALQTRKPWAINRAHFAPSVQPIYLLNMAVDPPVQRRGIGRALLQHARSVVAAWPGDAICLDAYDAEAGAGPFYTRCGFREVDRATYRATPLIYYEYLMSETLR